MTESSTDHGKVSVVVPCYNHGAMLRVAFHGGSFVHLPQIGFDYRVREDSLAQKMLPHIAEITDYVFAKPEMACYKLIRGTDEEVQQLRAGIRAMEDSPSYRLGRALLARRDCCENCGAVFTEKCVASKRAQH